jgi:signal transduction histidine kinase
LQPVRHPSRGGARHGAGHGRDRRALDPRHDRLKSLADYVCQFAREFLEPTGLRLRLDVPALLPDAPVPSAVRHHRLRVLKEALHNALRHAAAREVTVRLGLEGAGLVLAVTDDGRGFTPDAPAGHNGGGHGLANLRQRLAAVGGVLRLTSRPGEGTRVEAQAPVAAPRPQRLGGRTGSRVRIRKAGRQETPGFCLISRLLHLERFN